MEFIIIIDFYVVNNNIGVIQTMRNNKNNEGDAQILHGGISVMNPTLKFIGLWFHLSYHIQFRYIGWISIQEHISKKIT